MIMNAFVTISSLLPLIEGPCSSDSISIRVFGFTITSFALLLQRKNMLKKIRRWSRSYPASQHIHTSTHWYFVLIYECICAEI